ncbi:MAG: NAD(P)H-hydrate epimerase [Halodesulfurarchaeum sp.]
MTAAEMREVDRIAVEDGGIELLQMMENAGRTLAEHVHTVGDDPVIVVAGNGGNGGGGLACARHLVNHDTSVTIVLDRDPRDLTGATAQQYRVLDEMDIPTRFGPDTLERVVKGRVIVDALVGYGLDGDVREPVRSLLESINRRTETVVSLDVPSGVDATSGRTSGVAVAPDRIVTLALPKTGLVDFADSLFLADIGIPKTVFDRLDVEYANPFGRGSSVELSV